MSALWLLFNYFRLFFFFWWICIDFKGVFRISLQVFNLKNNYFKRNTCVLAMNFKSH